MKMSQGNFCIKSGLPVSCPSICKMCKRSCHLAGSRGKQHSGAIRTNLPADRCSEPGFYYALR